MFLFDRFRRSLGLDDGLNQPHRKSGKDQSFYNQSFFNQTLAEAAPPLPGNQLPERQQPSSQRLLPARFHNSDAHTASMPADRNQNSAIPAFDTSNSSVHSSNDNSDSSTVMRNISNMARLSSSNAPALEPISSRTQTARNAAIVLSQQSAKLASSTGVVPPQNGQSGAMTNGAITVSAPPSLPIVSQEMQEIANVALRQADIFIKQQEWEKAVTACDRALSIDPTVAEAHKLMGNVLQYMGNPADAISCYVEALVLKPKYPEVYANLGTVYSTLEDWEQALIYYNKAVDLNPEFVGAYRHLVKAWRQLGKPQNYVATVQQAAGVSPDLFTAEEHCGMGDRLLKEGKEQDAIVCFNRALSQQGDHAAAHQALAQVLEKQGKWEQAVNHYTKVLDSGQPSPPPQVPQTSQNSTQMPRHLEQRIQKPLVETPITEDSEHTKGGDDAEALAISIDSLVSLARSYVQNDNYEKAVTHYKNALRLDPSAAAVYQELAEVLTQAGQPEQALESWYRVVMLQSEWATPSRCVDVGNQLLTQNQPSKAVDCYRQALKLDAQYQPAQSQLKAVLNSFSQSQGGGMRPDSIDPVTSMSQQEDGETVRLNTAVDTAEVGGVLPKKSDAGNVGSNTLPSDANALAMEAHKQGEAFSEQKRWNEAIEAYQKAIALSPDFSWSHHNLGKALFALEDWQGAVEAQRNAIALKSDFFWSHASLGDALNSLQKWDEAAQAYQKALDIDPACQSIICKLADTLKLCGQANLEKASSLYLKGSQSEGSEESVYREALALNPQAIDVYLKLARVLEKEERLDEVIFTYQTARYFAPNNTEILLGLSRILLQKKQWEDAEECLNDALKVEPENSNLYFYLGELYSSSGKLDKAEGAFQKSISLNSSSHWTFQALGNVYTWMGQYQRAVSTYQQAIDLNPIFAPAYKQMGDALTALGRSNEASDAYGKALEVDPTIL